MKFDIIFLSYDEPNADHNFKMLRDRFPYAKRQHGVKGMHQAFRSTADLTETTFYFVVDADNLIRNDFNFEYDGDLSSEMLLVIWQAQNAVNDLVYGYGGIKLFGRAAAQAITEQNVEAIDIPGVTVRFVKQDASLTTFNSSPYDSWKAGFRECAMLTHASRFRISSSDAQERLAIWLSCGEDRPYGDWARRGAHDGCEFAIQCADNLEKLQTINNFEVLRGLFLTYYQAMSCGSEMGNGS